MVVRASQQDRFGGKGFHTGSVWWFEICYGIYVVVSDSLDLHVG